MTSIDGCAYDFAASLRHYLCRHRGWRAIDCPEPVRWEFYEDWGLSLQQFLAFCHQGVDAGVVFSHGFPLAGTRDAFGMLKAAGHTVHIITDRSFGTNGRSEGATRAWLDRHHLPYDSLTFAHDKTIVGVEVMVDDKLENYDAMESAGVETYLLKRPWNRAGQPSRRSVLDLLHYAEVICGKP